MTIKVTICDNRTEKEFTSFTDKLPENKIIKTPGVTLHCIHFILEENLIIIDYHFNEIFGHQKSFRRYNYPNVELNEHVIDDLIDLIYDKLYIENVLYLSSSIPLEYPQDAVLDKVVYKGLTLIKYINKYKPLTEITLEEKEKPELSENIKKLLLSEELEFICPEKLKEINWTEHLGFQPSEILMEEFEDDITILTFFKAKLEILVHHFIRGDVLDYYRNNAEHIFLTVNKLSYCNVIENDRIIDKVNGGDCAIYRCKEKTNIKYVIKLVPN